MDPRPQLTTPNTSVADGPPESSATILTVFVVDDYPEVRHALHQLIDEQPGLRWLGEAASAADARASLRTLHPDIALLDIGLPDGSGIDICRLLRSREPSTRCLMLTSHDDDDALFAAVLGGAAGYVTKQLRGPEILTAIERAARGESLLDPLAVRQLLQQLQTAPTNGAGPGPGPDRTDTPPGLTEVERSLLGLVTEGLDDARIAERMSLTEKSVRARIAVLFARLSLHRRRAAQGAPGSG